MLFYTILLFTLYNGDAGTYHDIYRVRCQYFSLASIAVVSGVVMLKYV